MPSCPTSTRAAPARKCRASGKARPRNAEACLAEAPAKADEPLGLAGEGVRVGLAVGDEGLDGPPEQAAGRVQLVHELGCHPAQGSHSLLVTERVLDTAQP